MNFEKLPKIFDEKDSSEMPKSAKEKRDESMVVDKIEEPEIKNEAFSSKEIEDINNIWMNDFNIQREERESKLLSGKKKLYVEKEVADYKARREKLVSSAIDKIEGSPEVKIMIESISSDDLEIITTQRHRYVNEHQTLSEEEKQKFREVFALENRFRFYLNNMFKIDILSGTIIYESLLEKYTDSGEGNKDREKEDKSIKVTYEYFDPVEELEIISKFNENEKMLSPKDRIKLKRERLEDFKKNLAEQKIGIAGINAELEEMVLADEKFDRSKLENYVSEKAELYKLSPAQLKRYEHVFNLIKENNTEVSKIAKKYSGRSDKELFAAIFGKKPVGEVKIEKGPISFFVICYDLKDYVSVYSGDAKDQALAASIGGHAHAKTIIPGLIGAVTVANAWHGNEDYLKTTKIHEEKHILNALIRVVEEAVDKITYKGEQQETDEKIAGIFLNKDRMRNEARAKDEILSYFKDGRGLKAIKYKLFRKKSDGGLYDYFEDDKKYFSYPKYAKFEKDLLEKVQQKFREKYEINIQIGLEIIGNLERIGFSREKIIGLFQTERLDSWHKVYERIQKSDEFNNLKEQTIRELEWEVKTSKNTRDYYKEALEKEKNKPRIAKVFNMFYLGLRNRYFGGVKLPEELSKEEKLEIDATKAQKDYEKTMRKKQEIESNEFIKPGEKREASLNFNVLIENLYKKYPAGKYIDKAGNRIEILYDKRENMFGLNQKIDNGSTTLFFVSQKWNTISSRGIGLTAEQFLEDIENFMQNFIKRG